MLRRSFRFGLLMGLLGGAAAALVRALQGRTSSPPAPVAAPAPWTPVPETTPVAVPPRPRIEDLQEPPTRAAEPAPPAPSAPAPEPLATVTPLPAKKAAAPKKKAAAPAPWVEPVDGECPPTHPIKAKMSSGIYHVPGGFNYARTRPDRCYRDVAAAEADGLRPSKR